MCPDDSLLLKVLVPQSHCRAAGGDQSTVCEHCSGRCRCLKEGKVNFGLNIQFVHYFVFICRSTVCHYVPVCELPCCLVADRAHCMNEQTS